LNQLKRATSHLGIGVFYARESTDAEAKMNFKRRLKNSTAFRPEIAQKGLLESDLFGHEKGAFTGAYATKKGFWEEAAGETLFLDEITESSPTVHAKLLRALQEGLIRQVGSNQEIKVAARRDRGFE
jgi:two-component system response regulator HydG